MIKTKETIKDIKVKDSKQILSHFIKFKAIKEKEQINIQEQKSQNTQAIDQIQNKAKRTVVQAITFQQKNHIEKQKKQSNRFINTKNNEFRQSKNDSVQRSKHQQFSKINQPAKQTNPMKKMTIQKQIKKQSETTKASIIHRSTKQIKLIIKKSIPSPSKIISLGISAVLLITMTLYVGTFSALAQTSITQAGMESLSAEVLAYRADIEKYAKQYDMEEYIQIIMAVMMQESGGKGSDPMQCSECPLNTRYPNTPNAITDPQYSIEIGIQYLASCFQEAQVKDVTDIERISLALQGYNYGNGYISWAQKNFGGYTQANAKVFSDMKKAELGTSGYGDPKYVDHVLRYVGFGFGDFRETPDFSNDAAWGYNNPYTRSNLCGQCTWFAWGRFYEIYGWGPSWTADGSDWVNYLVTYNGFQRSNLPSAGAVFSGIGVNHVGIIIAVEGNNVTVQEGNLDGITNSCTAAKTDWWTKTYTLDTLRNIYGGVEFAKNDF